MGIVLFIHLMAIAIWIGCVATETVCELTQRNNRTKENYIARLHWNIDRFVEIPAIIFAAITGIILIEAAPANNLVTLKIYFGIAAVVLNSFASYTVYQRYRCLVTNDQKGYDKYDLLHERVGIGCIISLSLALFTGGYYLTIG